MEITPIDFNPYQDEEFKPGGDYLAPYFKNFRNLPPRQENEFEWRIPNFPQIRSEAQHSPYFIIEEGVLMFYLELRPCGKSNVGDTSVSLHLFIEGYGNTYFPNTKYSLTIINYVDWRKSRFRYGTCSFTHEGDGWANFLTYGEVQSEEFWSPSGEMYIRARVQLDMTASNRRTPIDCNPFKLAGLHIGFRNFAHFEDLPPLETNEYEWRIPNFAQLRNSNDHLKYENSSYFVIDEGESRFYLNLKPCGESDKRGKSVSLNLYMDGYGNTIFPNTKYSLAVTNYVDWRRSRFRVCTSTFTDQYNGHGWENFLTYEDVQSKEFWSPSGEMIVRARVQLDVAALNVTTPVDTRNEQFLSQLLEDVKALKMLAKETKSDTESHNERLKEMAIKFNNIESKLQRRVNEGQTRRGEEGENP